MKQAIALLLLVMLFVSQVIVCPHFAEDCSHDAFGHARHVKHEHHNHYDAVWEDTHHHHECQHQDTPSVMPLVQVEIPAALEYYICFFLVDRKSLEGNLSCAYGRVFAAISPFVASLRPMRL